MITQRLVKEMGGDISFHSQPNRGSTFWFHISLDLNPNAIPDTLNTDGLVGKRLAYVEANATAAQCTLGDAGRYAAGGYLQPYLLLAGGSAV